MAEMVTDSVMGAVAELAALDVGAASRDMIEVALRSVGRMRGWLDALEVRLARRLEEVSSYPEKVLADAGRSDLRAGERVVQRGETAALAPAFEDALADGTVTAAHVDALGRALRRLETGDRVRLLDDTDGLIRAASTATVEDFTRTLHREISRLSADDGEACLARQQRATRLRTWLDPVDGMWCVYGRFDPDTGRRLDARVRGALAALFAEAVPEACPTHPGEKQDHLRALTVAALIEGRATGATGTAGRAEGVVVVDATSPDGPVVDWGLPVELPRRVLEELFGVIDPTVVVVRNGVVLYAPGQLDLGRSTRLANRAQRRALRALYPTCAVPGCCVRYDYTKLHHLIWWEHGGTTDLRNLIPLCEKHHHAVHDGGWILQLGPHRNLTVILPDGQVMSTGPPGRRAA